MQRSPRDRSIALTTAVGDDRRGVAHDNAAFFEFQAAAHVVKSSSAPASDAGVAAVDAHSSGERASGASQMRRHDTVDVTVEKQFSGVSDTFSFCCRNEAENVGRRAFGSRVNDGSPLTLCWNEPEQTAVGLRGLDVDDAIQRLSPASLDARARFHKCIVDGVR